MHTRFLAILFIPLCLGGCPPDQQKVRDAARELEPADRVNLVVAVIRDMAADEKEAVKQAAHFATTQEAKEWAQEKVRLQGLVDTLKRQDDRQRDNDAKASWVQWAGVIFFVGGAAAAVFVKLLPTNLGTGWGGTSAVIGALVWFAGISMGNVNRAVDEHPYTSLLVAAACAVALAAACLHDFFQHPIGFKGMLWHAPAAETAAGKAVGA